MNLSILNEFQPIVEEIQQNMSPHFLEHLVKEKGLLIWTRRFANAVNTSHVPVLSGQYL